MNKFRIIVFLIILRQILPSGSTAQVKTLDPVAFPEHFQIHKLMTETGFSVRFIDNAYQDQYGFIWIGTQFGTHMFDGYNIRDVRLWESDSAYSMLPDVKTFIDDKDGGLWLCGSYRGLCYYDRLTNIMTVQRRFTDFRSPMRNRVYGIFQDRTGLYWVFTESGLFQWNRDTDSVSQTEVESKLIWRIKSGRDDFNLIEKDDGSVWIPSSSNGLFRYLPETGEFINYRHDPSDPGSISSDNVTDIVEDSRGRLWVSTLGGGLNILSDAEQGIFEHIRHDPGNINTIPGDIIMDLMVDRSGNIWMAGQGFTKYQASTDELISYNIELEPFHYRTVNLNDFYKIVEDPDGHIWLRTHWYGGVFLFDPELERIYSLNDNHGQFPAENTRVFDVFIDPGGMIWVVTADGTAIIEKKPLKQFHLLGNELKIAGSVYQFDVNRIFSDSQGTLWTGIGEGMVIKCPDAGMDLPFESSQCQILEIGVELHSIVEIDSENLYMFADNRLHRFNRNSERLSLLPFDTTIDSILGDARVMKLYRDSNGYIWIGTYTDGIVVYDPASGQQAYHEYDYDDLEGIPPGQLAFREDDKGNLWMGAFGRGISILNKSQVDGIFTSDKLSINRISKRTGESRGLSSDRVLVIHCDSKNRMWIGTASGLNLYSPQDERFYSFQVSDGLPDECICGILEDDHGNLWISTFKGICKLVLKEGYGKDIIQSVHNYGVLEGIEDPFFTVRSYFKSTDGWMYFESNDGITVFHPDSIKEDPVIPPVHITSIQINEMNIHDLNKPILEKPLFETEQISLPFRQNFLSFEYVALNYLIPEKTRYKYMMEGLDKDWVEAGTRRFAEYRDLKPGKYTFRVIACNEDGLWNEEGASIGIIINPPWYRTMLAYIIYILLFGASVYGFIRWRTWRLRKDKQALEKEVRTRTQEIRQQKEKIESQRDELASQKDVLALQRDELESQREELESQRDELETTLENLKQAQTQLIQSEKLAALGGLVAGVAHEINTPVGISVTAVSSMAEETREMAEKYKANKISRAEFNDYLNTANQSAKLILSNMEKAATMIQSFKQVSVDQSTEQKRKFKLKEYSEDVIRSLYPKLKDKNIEISIDIDEKLVLDSYPGAYSQVLTNLILNSLVHGFEGREEGSISLSAKADKSSLTVEYTDNGKGIPQEHVPRIFDPFFTTNKKAGSGLGLHIVHNLVIQKLNGSISCESEVNKRTTFTIELPFSK